MTDRPRRQPTRAVAVPLVLGVALYALTVLTGSAWFTLLAGAGAGVLVATALWRPRVEGLQVCVSGPSRAAVGERVAFRLHVHNQSDRDWPALVLVLNLPGTDLPRVLVDPVPAGGRAVVDLASTARARGAADTVTLLLTWTAPLGLMSTVLRTHRRYRFVVHPRPRDVAPAPDVYADSDAGGPVPRPVSEVAGVRAWRPGDPASSVHWRSTARRGTLVVRERPSLPRTEVTVLLAASTSAPDGEDVLALAAAAGRAAQLAGHDLRLWVWSRGRMLPAPPVQSVTSLLDWWSALESTDLPSAGDVAARLVEAPAHVQVALSAAAPPGWWDEVEAASVSGGGTAHRLQETP